MEVLKALRFVKGAVAKGNTSVDTMKHFAIENGQVRATNGVITLGCPIDVDVTAAPEAARMYKAIDNCKDVVSFNLTETNRLSIRSGKFRALVPCVDMLSLPHPKPQGHDLNLPVAEVYDAFEALENFVGTDELRPFTNGVLLRGKSAYSTNNVTLLEYWIGVELNFTLNVPLKAVKQVLAAGVPERILADANSITFMYEDGRWIRSALLDTEWPPLERILDVPSNPQPVPEDLFDAVRAVDGFNDPENRLVTFADGEVRARTATDAQAAYAVAGLAPSGVYRADVLLRLQGVATSIDFSRYPEHAIFFGPRLRGAIMAYNS